MCVPPPLRSLLVDWHFPYQLLRTQITMATSAIIGGYAEYHLNQAGDQPMRSTSTGYTAAITVALCLLVLVGCTRERTRLRYTSGLPPVSDAAMVTQSTQNQSKIITELTTRAGLIAIPPKGSDDWGVFVEAGFNFIDEECNRYLDSLFWFDRYRKTTQNQIAITGAATAAIMGLAGAAAEAIAATAAAFGFLTATVDNVSNSVLYELEPSGIKMLVDRSRAQYRAAAKQRNEAKEAYNQPAAMSLIQGYLALCLPATIETQVNGAVSDTDFVEDKTAEKSLVPKLRRVPQTNVEAAIRREPLRAEAPLPRTPPAPTGVLQASSPVERALSLSDGKAVQQALCIEPDGDFGDKTRDAIALYYAAKARPGQRVLRTSVDVIELMNAGPCEGTLYRNAYERFEFASPNKIKDLQQRINLELQERGLGQPINASGVFDQATREAIKRIQEARREPATGAIRPELNNEIGVQ